MKNLLIALGLSALSICFLAFGNSSRISDRYYSDTGLIMETPEKNEEGFYEVVITEQNGHEFVFKSEDGDWCKGDIVSVIFDSKETKRIFDDEIISYKYSGWISDEEIQKWIK